MSKQQQADREMALTAVAAAGAAITDLVQIVRDADADPAAALQMHETVENLADALQCVTGIEYGGAKDTERRRMLGDLLAACNEFLDGWS